MILGQRVWALSCKIISVHCSFKEIKITYSEIGTKYLWKNTHKNKKNHCLWGGEPSSEDRGGEGALEFPGGLVIRTWCFRCGGTGSVPGWETEIPQAVWCGRDIKKNKKGALLYPFILSESYKCTGLPFEQIFLTALIIKCHHNLQSHKGFKT